MSGNRKYYLRPMKFSDLEMVLGWRNSDKIRANMFTDDVISMEQHRMWFENMQTNGSSAYLIFEYYGVPSGVVNFVQLDLKNTRCHWGFYLGRDDLPKGTGTEMCKEGLLYGFEELHMRKICGEAFAFNISSIKLHEKLGFQPEGLLRNHVIKNGIYEDVVVFGLLKEDFQRKFEKGE